MHVVRRRRSTGATTSALGGAALALVAHAGVARAQRRAAAPATATGAQAPRAAPAGGSARASGAASVTLGGYVEAFYAWNFNDPSNGITAYRGFDNRHNAFTLANVVLDASWAWQSVSGRLALQIGHTPETYYLAEPDRPGAGGTGASNRDVWKFLQQANVGWRAPVGRGLLLEAGLFLSPIGPETMAIRDAWNWSRSNLFYGLPFYHTGVRATYPLSDRVAVAAAVFNGWNSVVDNNAEKSVVAQLTYALPERLALSVLYFGGVERPPGAPEGRAWRHLFDAHVTVYPTAFLALRAHANAGFEPNTFGVSAWAAGALYARLRAARWLFAVVRTDFFYEHVAQGDRGQAAGIFWPSRWVGSSTATLDARPADHVSVRLEYRHDHAADDTYFRGRLRPDPASGELAPNAPAQDTVTLGMVVWF